MPSVLTISFFLSLLSSFHFVEAGLNAAASNNVAVYWGRNSNGQGSGPLAQQRLSYYCANSQLSIIPLAFLTTISNPTLNLASAGDLCTPIPGSSLFYCSQVEEDIKTCQQTYGKTILLSIGGATYTEGGFASPSAATGAASNIWSIFGPKTAASNIPRPFGDAIIDGFDFDFESTVSNMVPFANQLRSLMDASTGKKYYLTAAPQCPYPDAADGEMLAGAVAFDFLFVQFYNNYCGIQSYLPSSATQTNFNFATWDTWAKTSSKNPNVKIMLGIPGAATAAGSGYMSGSALGGVIAYSKTFSSFGGVMVWDVTQIYANSGFMDSVSGYLGLPATGGGSALAPTTMATVVVKPTSKAAVFPELPTAKTTPVVVVPTTPTPPTTAASGGNLVNQWLQCGGKGWNGGTVCKAPYKCVYMSVWYSDCR